MRIAKNTIYQIIARIISSGTSFIVTILIARHFGIASYGDFAKVTAVVTLFYLLADFGFNAVFLQNDDSKLHFKDLFYLRFFISGALILFINLLSLFLPYNQVNGIGFSAEVRLGILIFSLTLITEGILYSSSVIFQRELTYRYFMLASFTGSVVTLVITGMIIILSLPLVYIFVGLIFGALMESGTALYLTKESLAPILINTVFVKKLFKNTLPLTFMLIWNAVYFRVDMLILSGLKSSTDVAMYDIAYKFFEFLVALPLFLSNALYPTLLKHQKNNRITSQMTQKFLWLFMLLSLPIVGFMWLAAPFIQLIRPGFLPAVLPLRILSLSLPIFFATSIAQWILISKRKQKLLAYLYFYSTVGNIMLNIILIPRYSYIASAAITGISEAMVLVVLWIVVIRE